MATNVGHCGDGVAATLYSVEVTDTDGDKVTIEVLPYGWFITPGQDLANGVNISKEDLQVLLEATQEVMA